MIRLDQVSKVYPLYPKPSDRLWEALSTKPRHSDFWAVRNVSFQVEPGEMLALVGPNGSGKSTLLQIAAGILEATEGAVQVDGRVAALLELGAGFNPEFTGRENVFLNGEILGRSRAEMREAFGSIVDFAGIGDYIDRPVREYSTGMYVRLAFATAIHVDPQVLIVDEALAVGDAMFANRCIRKFEELKEKGVTLLFVSHDLGLVKRLADRAILLWKGEIAAEGDPADVANRYVGLVHTGEVLPEPAGAPVRHGDGASRILDITLHDETGERRDAIDWGVPIEIRIRARAERALERPVVGMLIRSRLGVDVFGTNSKIEQCGPEGIEAGEEFEVAFQLDCFFGPGDYTITAATQHYDGRSQDWLDDARAFHVISPRAVAGLASPPVRVHWRTGSWQHQPPARKT